MPPVTMENKKAAKGSVRWKNPLSRTNPFKGSDTSFNGLLAFHSNAHNLFDYFISVKRGRYKPKPFECFSDISFTGPNIYEIFVQ